MRTKPLTNEVIYNNLKYVNENFKIVNNTNYKDITMIRTLAKLGYLKMSEIKTLLPKLDEKGHKITNYQISLTITGKEFIKNMAGEKSIANDKWNKS